MLRPIGEIKEGEKMNLKEAARNIPLLTNLVHNMGQVEESVRNDFILNTDDSLTQYCLFVLEKNKKQTQLFLEDTENDIKELIAHTKLGMYSPARLVMGKVVPSSHLYSKASETCFHQISSMLKAVKIARTVGLTQEEQRELAIGMANHDIGKYLLLDIVSKPGRLNVSEELAMRMHPEIGYAVLKASGYEMPEKSLEIVMSHHERADGSGYPNGLKDIPDIVKIATIADIFDALTDKKRPYRKRPYTLKECVSIMIDDAYNGKIDKGLTDVLVGLNRASRNHPAATGYYSN